MHEGTVEEWYPFPPFLVLHEEEEKITQRKTAEAKQTQTQTITRKMNTVESTFQINVSSYARTNMQSKLSGAPNVTISKKHERQT
eukprot:757833-Hanusia_phi.AAC.2